MIKSIEFMRGALLTSLLLIGMSEPAEANAKEESGLCDALYGLGKQSVLARYRGASLELLLSIMEEERNGKPEVEYSEEIKQVVIGAYGFEIAETDDPEQEAINYGQYVMLGCEMLIE
jgi:hypothetical protein